MPYCTNCGTEVVPNASYCGHCGNPQPRRTQSAPPSGYTYQTNQASYTTVGPFDNITPRTASILCYIPVFGIIPAIIILASRHFRTEMTVRFNAFQSVYLFVAFLVVKAAMGLPGWGLEHALLELIKLAFFGTWILLLVKASQNQQLHLPLIGDLAARSATEQL